jgi:hypothetical protein
MMTSNKQICEELLASLPPDFYGSIELSFVKGTIMQSKTTTSRKYNPEAKPPEYDYRRK